MSANKVPMQLRAAKRLLKKYSEPKPEEYFLYFLVRRDEVVYVGITYNLIQRMQSHEHRGKFDSAFYIPLGSRTKHEAKCIEWRFIRRLRPRYNRAGIRTRTTDPRRKQVRVR